MEQQLLLVALTRLSVVETRALALCSRRAGMSSSAYAILRELALDGWLTNGQLAERLGMSTGGVTPAIDRLQAAGYVSRSPNPADRRSSVVSITAAGQALLRPPVEAFEAAMGPALAGLEPEQAQAVLRVVMAAQDAYLGLAAGEYDDDDGAVLS